MRRAPPPNYELTTRPGGLNELELPPLAEDVNGCWQCVHEHVGAFFDRVKAALEPEAVGRSFFEKVTLFTGGLVDDESRVLVWFSGKDLLCGLKPWGRGNRR